MPKKTIKAAPFMIFVKEYQNKNPKIKLDQAIQDCNPIWSGLSQAEKDTYKNKAKSARLNAGNPEKYTSQGIPFSMLEKEKLEREKKDGAMIKEIVDTVIRTRNVGTLADQKYYIIMGNYFFHQLQGDIFYPAEIAICEYSLNNGILRKYHSLLNPKKNIFGYTYEAQTHADNTHGLPLANDAIGESDLGLVYQKLYDFISKSGYSKVPPVYTHSNNIRILESMLLYMKDQCDEDTEKIRVFPLQQLFYELKKVTAGIGNTKIPNSIHITNAILDQDYYEHQSGIACDFHEMADKYNYCALSYVIRWAYTFSDCMCTDLSIDVLPGCHIPVDIDMTLVAGNSHESYCRSNTEDFLKSDQLDCNISKETRNNEDTSSYESFSVEGNSNDDYDSYNPWASRSKLHIPPADDESFVYSTGSVGGRGRGIAVRSLNASQDSILNNDSNSSLISSYSAVLQRSCGRGKTFF